MLLNLFFVSVNANYFIWNSNVRFGDMERWNKEVTRPCLESRVTFKSDEVSSILIDIDFTLSDLTMPSNFEMILDESVTIGTDHDISGCTDPSDYVFDAGPESWYNISKWQIYDRNPDRGGGSLIDFCRDDGLYKSRFVEAFCHYWACRFLHNACQNNFRAFSSHKLTSLHVKLI